MSKGKSSGNGLAALIGIGGAAILFIVGSVQGWW